jgi:hypothetical protein
MYDLFPEFSGTRWFSGGIRNHGGVALEIDIESADGLIQEHFSLNPDISLILNFGFINVSTHGSGAINLTIVSNTPMTVFIDSGGRKSMLLLGLNSSAIHNFDVDGDGTNNAFDEFPLDITDWQDTDGDGVGNNVDDDDDEDGWNDTVELECESDAEDLESIPLQAILNGDCLLESGPDLSIHFNGTFFPSPLTNPSGTDVNTNSTDSSTTNNVVDEMVESSEIREIPYAPDEVEEDEDKPDGTTPRIGSRAILLFIFVSLLLAQILRRTRVEVWVDDCHYE